MTRWLLESHLPGRLNEETGAVVTFAMPVLGGQSQDGRPALTPADFRERAVFFSGRRTAMEDLIADLGGEL